MKTIKISAIVFAAVLIVGCKNKEQKKDGPSGAVVEETFTTLDPIPRASDTYFKQALEAYQQEDRATASKMIVEGKAALQKEGKDISGQSKLNLDLATEQLTNIAGKLDENVDISIDGFREAVANAEINISHGYLATEDSFVITPKDVVKENNLHKALARNLKNLETGSSKLKDDAKKEGEKLADEGKKLNEAYQDWKKRAEAHAKKTEEHFKKYQPEYVYP